MVADFVWAAEECGLDGFGLICTLSARNHCPIREPEAQKERFPITPIVKTSIVICVTILLMTACSSVQNYTEQAGRRIEPEKRSTEAEIRLHIIGVWTVEDGSDGCWYPTLIIGKDGTIVGAQTNGTKELIGTWEMDRTALRVTPTPARFEQARKAGYHLNEWDYYPVIYADDHELVMTPGFSMQGRWKYTGLSLFAAEEDSMRFSARGDLNRAKTYFSIITNLDSQRFADAEALFNTLPDTNGWGGILYDGISSDFRDHEYAQARDRCLSDIHFWIIATACDWQDPYLTMLLDDPHRLSFLQELYAYCQKFPSQTEGGLKSEALVADILQKANERKRNKQKIQTP
jgi:hypothetical protein